MLLNSFKDRILQKRVKKSLKNNTVTREIAADKITTIGVLASASTPNLNELVILLQKEFHCEITPIFLFKEFEKNKEVLQNEFTNKDLNWKLNFIHPNLVEFINEPLSLLVGYFNTNNIYLKNAILQSNAKFKVGFSTIEEPIYELTIDTKIEDHKVFVFELKKYLIALNKVKI